MNIDLFETSAIDKYLNSMKLNGCHQGIKELTRVTTTSKSLLDHIVHNDCLNNLEFDVIKTNITDHDATSVHLDITKSQSIRFRKTTATILFLEIGYHREILKLLSNLEQQVDRLTESLADALTTAVNVFFFKDKIKFAISNKTWFDKNVKKS